MFHGFSTLIKNTLYRTFIMYSFKEYSVQSNPSCCTYNSCWHNCWQGVWWFSILHYSVCTVTDIRRIANNSIVAVLQTSPLHGLWGQDQPTTSLPLFMCLWLMEGHRQRAIFVFPEQCGSGQTWAEKERSRSRWEWKGEKQREGKANKKKTDAMSCASHLFPIGKVVRHSTAGSTDVSPTQGKGNRR